MNSSDFGILLLAVGELARRRRDAQGILSGELAPCGQLRARWPLDHLADDDLGLSQVFLETGGQRLVEHVLDYRAHFEDTSLCGLRENFGSGTFTESTAMLRPSRQSSPVGAIFSRAFSRWLRHSR